MKYLYLIFTFLIIAQASFSQSKEEVLTILKQIASDDASVVFFHNETTEGPAMIIQPMPIVGDRRVKRNPWNLSFNNLTVDDLRGFDRPILIQQQEPERTAESSDISQPSYVYVLFRQQQPDLLQVSVNSVSNLKRNNYTGNYIFEKSEDWEIVDRKIEQNLY